MIAFLVVLFTLSFLITFDLVPLVMISGGIGRILRNFMSSIRICFPVKLIRWQN